MKGQIFISYRRDDSSGTTGRLYDRLSKHFANRIFFDVDNIPPGEDFVEAIERTVENSDILIAVIGKKWLSITDLLGHRLLDNVNDFVRAEIRAALERKIRVIPILVENAIMPSSADLPKDISALARRNAIEVRHTRFDADVDRLTNTLKKIIEEQNIKAEEQRIKKEQTDKIEKEEEELWRNCESEDTLLSLQSYLASYPAGKYNKAATEQITQKYEEERIKKQQDLNNYKDLGIKAFQQQKFEEASNHFKDAIKTEPDDTESKKWLTRINETIIEVKEKEELRKKAEPRKTLEEKRLNETAYNHTTKTFLPWIFGGVAVLLMIIVVVIIKNWSGAGPEQNTLPIDSQDSALTDSNTIERTELNMVNNLEQDMVIVNGGSFSMGTNKSENESPAHKVVVNSFRIGKYEVTREQWNAIIKDNKFTRSMNLPMTGISWDEVQNFIQKINVISGKKFRLPSESEWEYACFNGYESNYGKYINSFSWNINNANDSLHMVGQTTPNKFGIYDMLGNAYEWCSNFYYNYKNNEEEVDICVIRGGDYKLPLYFVSPKIRNKQRRNEGGETIGFRLAMSIEN